MVVIRPSTIMETVRRLVPDGTGFMPCVNTQ